MSKLITVTGATGIQGGSVVTALLNNPAYAIRAVVRNSQSDAAKALASRGAEVVEADFHSVESLKKAFAGSYGIFAVSAFFDGYLAAGLEKAAETEIKIGSNMADAAAATESLKHYVWSTLPNSSANVGEGRVVVPYYVSKQRVDDHIKSIPQLLAKTTFFMIPWYSSNMDYPQFHPTPVTRNDGSKVYVQFLNVPKSTLVPLAGDVKTNAGLFVKAILQQPEKTLGGKYVSGLVEQWTFEKVLSTFVSGKQVEPLSLQVSNEDYRNLYGIWGEVMGVSHDLLKYTDGKSFDVVGGQLTKDDLGVQGLVSTADAFAAMSLMN